MQEQIDRDNITVILHRPKYAGNIGSTARCMKNMGIGKLIVVRHERPDVEEIKQMATHFAANIVDSITYLEDLGEALSPFRYVVGTTARKGGKSARQPVKEPRDLAHELVDISRNNDVALVFGPEDRGLTNDELKFCHALVTIPTADKLKSLNLSHAVMVCCYEMLLARREPQKQFTPRLATSRELEAMYEHLKKVFIMIEFIQHGNPDYWMMYIRRFLSRIHLYSKEVNIVRGICRHIERYVA